MRGSPLRYTHDDRRVHVHWPQPRPRPRRDHRRPPWSRARDALRRAHPGRGRGATVALDDPDVSRQHARIVVEPEGLTIFDLGSKNGLRVDGRRIHDAVTLGHGDELTVGEITLRLQHPAAQVAQALAAAGEATVTITNTKDEREAPMMGLLWPVVGVLVFGTAVVALLLV
ncbi:MAG: FHA domain-containing protein [Nannocystaceae bacterium]